LPIRPDQPGPRAEDRSQTAATIERSDLSPAMVARTAMGGVLMGIANLIPGVSGGTMILAMGLYERFIEAVADLTAFRFKLREIVFLGILGAFAAGSIAMLSGVILYLLFAQSALMFALFIGLTLGGTPALLRMMGRPSVSAIAGAVIAFALMAAVASGQGGAALPRNTTMDVVAGLVGSTTMVLPGISGSYMLLVMNQYDRVLGAVDDLRQGIWSAWSIIIPVGIGAVIGIVGLSNLLKVLLRRYEKATLGFLLGLLLGSVLGLWPFGRAPTEKILEKRNDVELRAYAQSRGMAGADDLEATALVEHVLLGWDLMQKPPERVAHTYPDRELRRFAEHENINGLDELKGLDLAKQIVSRWAVERKPGTSAGEMMLALAAAVVGFLVTTLLGRMSGTR